ncbi:ATP-binding protein [Paenibacillus crassostreae]|uniref:histidine kinase n=1 Tax=Paenibacillus crassostreae TaxID=1763538 RepID=A0A167GRW0_9BACL|nr:ATP-binding protein [Paenibacillus crassostreae]AOZ92035.1 sensor histidine kinase [Paenibacillus crassostreae]OAB77844.1 histidine kinase [Paenibacillus crassostreae]
MKLVPKMVIVMMVLIMIILVTITTTIGGVQQERTIEISEWKLKWTSMNDLTVTAHNISLEQQEGWIVSDSNESISPDKTSEFIWYKIELPEMIWNIPSLYISEYYGKYVIVRTDSAMIYESEHMNDNIVNKIILPLERSNSNETLYIGVETNKDTIGTLILGNYSDLLSVYVKQGLIDVILGSSFIFISMVMLICSFFLRKEFLAMWVSLAIIIFSTSVLMLTYSSYMYTLFGQHEEFFIIVFDCALFILLPSLTFFFEVIFGSGYRSVLKYFCKFQVGYSVVCFILMLMNFLFINKFYVIYYFVSAQMLGYTIIIQCILLVFSSIVYIVKKNKDALILSIGFTLFAGTALFEMIQFYARSGDYNFIAWKWGVVSFIVSLIAISGRKFTDNHDQIVQYSKELELINNELQRSEKLEIISELAASVAHEVRNPLQVTRGFLQLLTERYEQEQAQMYLIMALDELDCASNIITDFLTFAKPDFDQITELNIYDELTHIESILIPLANLSDGVVSMDIPHDLSIMGNSSKFKQALINLIKNSIEAWNGRGIIRIWAYKNNSIVTVHIEDNGVGMDQEELTRLGAPYFSNKTKGTGLGLMVSFRIIEAMQGEIQYKSQKGAGTEAIITFPSSK